MPERGWVVLTVREHVGSRIKEFARSRGLTVSDYLERLIAVRPRVKPSMEEWVTCGICGARLKARNIPEHRAKVHPKIIDSQLAEP